MREAEEGERESPFFFFALLESLLFLLLRRRREEEEEAKVEGWVQFQLWFRSKSRIEAFLLPSPPSALIC